MNFLLSQALKRHPDLLHVELSREIEVKGRSIALLTKQRYSLEIEYGVEGKPGIAFVVKNDVGNTVCQFFLDYFVAEVLPQNRGRIARNLMGIGGIHHSWGDHDEAIARYQEALHISQSMGNRNLEAENLRYLGRVYVDRQQFTKAEEHCRESLKIWQELENQKEIARGYIALGVLYYSAKRYNQALVYYHRALPIFQKLGMRTNIASCWNSIGKIYQEQKKYQQALSCYHQALKIDEELQQRRYRR